MTDTLYLTISVATMALVTYFIRMLPLAVFRKRIKSKFMLNFLYYVPYAVLAAMTIPAVFYSTELVPAAIAGFAAAVILSYFERGLLTVAIASCAAALAVQLIIQNFL